MSSGIALALVVEALVVFGIVVGIFLLAAIAIYFWGRASG